MPSAPDTLAHRLCETCEDIVDACREAWTVPIVAPETVVPIVTRNRANLSRVVPDRVAIALDSRLLFYRALLTTNRHALRRKAV